MCLSIYTLKYAYKSLGTFNTIITRHCSSSSKKSWCEKMAFRWLYFRCCCRAVCVCVCPKTVMNTKFAVINVTFDGFTWRQTEIGTFLLDILSTRMNFFNFSFCFCLLLGLIISFLDIRCRFFHYRWKFTRKFYSGNAEIQLSMNHDRIKNELPRHRGVRSAHHILLVSSVVPSCLWQISPFCNIKNRYHRG